jgi:histidine ammonia-lyase
MVAELSATDPADAAAGALRLRGPFAARHRRGAGPRVLRYDLVMIALDGSSLTLDALMAVARDGAAVTLDPAARARVEAARAVVDRKAAADAPVYGINTGFGSLADVRIPHEQLEQLQVNLLRSHSAGVGDPLPVFAVRAMMALRANVLAKGYSGIRTETLDQLIALLNHGVHPVVPSRGSVGASGDLAPLAHLALVLIGEGLVLHPPAPPGPAAPGMAPMPAMAALRHAGLAPIRLAPKEGLALINGTQASTGVLALAVDQALRVARTADIVAALSLDVLKGSIHPFEPRIHAPRPFAGQRASAANLLALVEGSAINKSHEFCGRVQDAYSLRCAPQVHGAVREALTFVRTIVEVESNAATDNPMVFADSGDIVSGGNFHGAPIGLAADTLAIAVTHLATISERRIERLTNPALSGLPAFLTEHGGLHSGLMMVQVTAAALASELKAIAHPASVDTIPTSANKEDHVSMSMAAALKAAQAVHLATHVVAIEALCAAQGLDLLRPLTSSPSLERVAGAIRRRVPRLVEDRPPAPDIAAIAALIETGALVEACALPLT